jgi:hypothetical protein
MAKLCKAARDHYELTQFFHEQWTSPFAGFGSLGVDPVKVAAFKRKERIERDIKDQLNVYHSTLKRVPNDEYYDLMDIREAELRKQYLTM